MTTTPTDVAPAPSGPRAFRLLLRALHLAVFALLMAITAVVLAGVVSRALDEVRLRRQHLATQQALELSERRYRAIVEDQSELIIRMQPDSTVNFVNGAYCRYFGYQPDQIRGRPVLASMSPENREALQRNLAGISPQAPAYERDSLVRNAAGAERWMHWSGRGIFDG